MSSAARYALGVHVNRIDRPAGRHHQPIAPAAAKTQIGATLGKGDLADHRCVRSEYDDTVERLAPAPPAPQIAIDIAAEAVRTTLPGVDEDATIGEFDAILDHVIDVDETGRPGSRLDEVEFGFVGEKHSPFGKLISPVTTVACPVLASTR